MPTYAVLFTLVLASGLLNQVLAADSAFFELNLALHPLLGVFATATIITTLFRRVRAEVPAFGPWHLASLVAICFVALARSFTMAHLEEQTSNIITALLSPILIGATAFFFLKTVPLLSKVATARHGWAHITLLSLWMLALLLGLLLISTAVGDLVRPWLFHFHSVIGYAAAAIGSWLLLRPAWRRPWVSGVPLGINAALCLLLVTRLVANRVERLADDAPAPSATVHLSVIPIANRLPEDRDRLPFPQDASWIEITETCLGAGCHAEIDGGFRHSLHNLSYRPEHVHKVLDLLAAELGPAERAICAGCHVPGSLFTGGRAPQAYRERTNISCVFCHSMTDAAVDDHQRSRYTLTLEGAALAPFRAAELAGQPLPRWRRMAIHLNPDAHGKAFSPPLLKQDGPCLACHHAQILPDGPPSRIVAEAIASDPDAMRCITCHMPPTRTLGGEQATLDHFFPGSNATTPALLGLDEPRRLTERWMQSQFLVRTFEDLYKKRDAVRRLGEDRKDAFFYADLAASFATPPRTGETAALTVTTHNLGMGHPFPASSLGLAEAWLEVRVTDAAGRTVFASGGLDERQRILDGSHTLGGRLLDAAGAPIDRYRVWAAAHEVIDRQIPYPGSVQDHFTFPVPADAERHLNVDAVWRYRKLGQEFWEWAYPDRPEIPSSEVVRTFTQFPLG